MSTFNGGDEWVASWKVESLNFDINTSWTSSPILVWLEVAIYVNG